MPGAMCRSSVCPRLSFGSLGRAAPQHLAARSAGRFPALFCARVAQSTHAPLDTSGFNSLHCEWLHSLSSICPILVTCPSTVVSWLPVEESRPWVAVPCQEKKHFKAALLQGKIKARPSKPQLQRGRLCQQKPGLNSQHRAQKRQELEPCKSRALDSLLPLAAMLLLQARWRHWVLVRHPLKRFRQTNQ